MFEPRDHGNYSVHNHFVARSGISDTAFNDFNDFNDFNGFNGFNDFNDFNGFNDFNDFNDLIETRKKPCAE